MSRRIVVLGGSGHFGAVVVRQLEATGIASHAASRRSADFRVDAEDPDSVRAMLREGDLVVDAAGPFQRRSPVLIEAAIELGFDVIDLNDSIAYAERVTALADRIAAAGIRVLSASSSVSALSAGAVKLSEVEAPARVTGFIVAATRDTAHAGSAISLFRSVGQPIRVFRSGAWVTARGWSESRAFPMPAPIGRVRGHLFESADSFHLPRIWPTLRTVEMFVDTNAFGLNALLDAAARSPVLRRFMERRVALGARLSRWLGSAVGGLGYEVEDAAGGVVRYAILSRNAGEVIAVSPAVLAARSIDAGTFHERGLVSPDRHVEAGVLAEHLRSGGVEIVRLPSTR